MYAFLSYTRVKDQFQIVSTFRDHLENELRQLNPTSIVFQDTVNMRPGTHFPDTLASELNRADVLLILLSPSWIQSEWCQRELELFTANGTDLLKCRRILPILWVDIENLLKTSINPLINQLEEISYSDWRELRHEIPPNPCLSRAFARLAADVESLLSQKAGNTEGNRSHGSAKPNRLVMEHILGRQYHLAEKIAEQELCNNPDDTELCVLYGIAMAQGHHLGDISYKIAKKMHHQFSLAYDNPETRDFAIGALVALKLEYFQRNSVREFTPHLVAISPQVAKISLSAYQRDALAALKIDQNTYKILGIR